MSEERPKGFLSRVFGPVEDYDDHTSVYQSRETEPERPAAQHKQQENSIQETGRSFTVERAAEIIKHLPPEVPRSSAVRIVRQTLVAAGINIEDLAASTRDRESRLEGEISQRQERIRNLKEKTDEEVRRLERQILEARETRDTGIASEERRISTARDGLSDVGRVREFFSLPKNEPQAPSRVADDDESPAATPSGPVETDRESTEEVSDETRIIDRGRYEREPGAGEDDTTVIRRTGPFSDDWNTSEKGREDR